MNQTQIEHLLCKRHLEAELKDDLKANCSKQISKAVQVIRKWCSIAEWDSKNVRKAFLSNLDLHTLVLTLLTKTVLHCQAPLPLVSIASMVHVGMGKLDDIRTVSELIATLEPLGLWAIHERSKTRMVESLIMPSEQLELKLNHACYIPPMIEKPDTLYRNNSCGLKTVDKDSLILGNSSNYHSNSISLDVLNTLNRNEYIIDNWVVENFEKDWHFKELSQDELAQLDQHEQDQYYQDVNNKEKYLEQFSVFYKHLKDKPIYLTHKVDKRGRVYTQGFHFSTQGTSFEKACISLKNQELATGEL